MPWELTIKHIRLGSIGDSTLIVATDGTTTRSVLIDGGLGNDAPAVDAQIVASGLAKLNVMVATHYDRDHYYGLSALLDMADPKNSQAYDPKYQGVRIYDQGESGTVSATKRAVSTGDEEEGNDDDDDDDDDDNNDGSDDDDDNGDGSGDDDDDSDGSDDDGDDASGSNKRKRGGDDDDDEGERRKGGKLRRLEVVALPPSNREAQFTTYLDAVKARKAVRVTRNVLSKHAVPVGLKGYHEPYQLVGREIMWDDAGDLSAAGDEKKIPAGAPKLRCIAANQYTLRDNGDVKLVPGAAMKNAERAANARSLAFLLEFGKFLYYVGGDLESEQEDTLLGYLSSKAVNERKLDVFKTSHHGSAHSSSDKFVSNLSPRVAIISCGDENQYNHPEQRVVNALETNNVCYFATGERLNKKYKEGLSAVLGGKAKLTNQITIARASKGNDATITVKITQTDAAKQKPVFKVSCHRADAGPNLTKDPKFKYVPSGIWALTFS